MLHSVICIKMYDRMTRNQKWVFFVYFLFVFFFLISDTHFLSFDRILHFYVFRYLCFERGYLTLRNGFAGIYVLLVYEVYDMGYIPANKIELFLG